MQTFVMIAMIQEKGCMEFYRRQVGRLIAMWNLLATNKRVRM